MADEKAAEVDETQCRLLTQPTWCKKTLTHTHQQLFTCVCKLKTVWSLSVCLSVYLSHCQPVWLPDCAKLFRILRAGEWSSLCVRASFWVASIPAAAAAVASNLWFMFAPFFPLPPAAFYFAFFSLLAHFGFLARHSGRSSLWPGNVHVSHLCRPHSASFTLWRHVASQSTTQKYLRNNYWFTPAVSLSALPLSLSVLLPIFSNCASNCFAHSLHSQAEIRIHFLPIYSLSPSFCTPPSIAEVNLFEWTKALEGEHTHFTYAHTHSDRNAAKAEQTENTQRQLQKCLVLWNRFCKSLP